MAVPLWALGRNLTLVSVTPQTANSSTGVLTPGTTVTFTGVVDEVEAEEQVTTEEISPITSFRENHVGLMHGTRLRIAEILTVQPSVVNTRGPQLLLMKSTLLSVGYAIIQWTHGGNTNTVRGLYERMSSPWRGKGKQVVTASFLPIDDGVDSWRYT